MKIIIFLFALISSKICFVQKDSVPSKFLFTIEQKNQFASYYSNSTKIYDGSEINISRNILLNQNNSIGLSLGWFYRTNNIKVRMKYQFFPIYLSFTHFLKKRNNFNLKIGTNVLSYFDSEKIIKNSDETNKSFWLSHNQVFELTTISRNKHWLIFQPSYNLKIIKNLYFSSGVTLYIGKSYLFTYLNLGLNYLFKKKLT